MTGHPVAALPGTLRLPTPESTRLLASLAPVTLGGLLRGVEREGLRVHADGSLATTPHPAALGAALTHPHITTDFSESQLELITGVHPQASACVAELTELHRFVYGEIAGEAIWTSSMPCRLPDDTLIPIGRYGSSHLGRLKTVYRTGLSYRYGKRMQTISGIHYNFSLPVAAWSGLRDAGAAFGSAAVTGLAPDDAFRSAAYFALIRNFRRESWLLLYLFGASPAVCRCFVEGRSHDLAPLGGQTFHLPYATSLRMGPLGYQSQAQASMRVSFNSLADYARSLLRGLTERWPAYERIGIRDGDDYRQLATTLIQIENEFYSAIRAKRRIRRGERPLHALMERGVEYIEVRNLDVDPYTPEGIGASAMRFLDAFLVKCLLAASPDDHPGEIAEIAGNQFTVAERGRQPGLTLRRGGRDAGLAAWGSAIVDECEPVADALDAAAGGHAHRDALAEARRRLADPDETPSARVLREVRTEHHDSFHGFALARSLANRAAVLALPPNAAARSRCESMARASLEAQREIEASDRVPFEEYRVAYLAQDLLAGRSFAAPGATAATARHGS
ncbi:MAG: glutamate--cysteine ligase [Proteobacteria bacterium]|nr:glutamate--cysteine ligase [Pseudomonadota bacterium]